MKKIFYFILAAVTMTLAACGDGNAPENNTQYFTIQVSDIKSMGAHVEITPKDNQMRYYYNLSELKKFQESNVGEDKIIDYYIDLLNAQYAELNVSITVTVEYLVNSCSVTGFTKIDYSELNPETEYILNVFTMNESNELVPNSWTTKTFKTTAVPENQSPVSAWYWSEGKVGFDKNELLILDDKQNFLRKQYIYMYPIEHRIYIDRGTYKIEGDIITLHSKESGNITRDYDEDIPLPNMHPLAENEYDESVKYEIGEGSGNSSILVLISDYDKAEPETKRYVEKKEVYNNYLQDDGSLSFLKKNNY